MLRPALLAATAFLVAATPLSPAQRFGALYARVEMARVFPDSKTFADATPRGSTTTILAAYRRCRCDTPDRLRAFVAAHFVLTTAPKVTPPPGLPLARHIDALWPLLMRTTTRVAAGSSRLTLPRPYIVPGGRFQEMYYWDSWFSMLGLQVIGDRRRIADMAVDFGSLIDRYGHVPNGTRTYYLSRSQPPVFYLIAGMVRDRTTLARRTRQLRAEHAFWMAGAAALKPGAQSRRVVRLADGTLLNRYWDDRDDPRDESYREDVLLARANPGRDAAGLYRDLRAAAESGWDFSSRWLGDGRTLGTIRTTRIVPVDLNSLMFGVEQAIADDCRALGDRACADDFAARADARRTAIRTHLWNGRSFADYDLDTGRTTHTPTAAIAFPLFVGAATTDQAKATAVTLAPLVQEGGLATTLADTGQQWDSPNGWAPLQWIAIQGLRRYGQTALADRIARGWLATVSREYSASGKLLEKYDVARRRPGGGGEYPNQDGFGWTNGVTRALLARDAGTVR